MGLRSDLEATQRELNDVRVERDIADQRAADAQRLSEEVQAVNDLLAGRVQSLAYEVNDLAEEKETLLTLLDCVPGTVGALRDERKWLYQTLAAIQSYSGNDPLVPSLLAEAALSEVAEIDYGFEDGEQV
jgi:uncharacterized protein (DUF3084 family)